MPIHSHAHNHSHGVVNSKTIKLLFVSFLINMLLTVVELTAGIYADSVALIGDALHNTSDAFSILIALIAYKIGTHKATEKFSFGFKRAETIGGFVNLILLFVAGLYLLYEGLFKILSPEPIDGWMIIYVSIAALIIDGLTAKLSHQASHKNTNMKMLFLHNLADALGSVGVIVSGLCVVFLNWTFVDGLIAIMIGAYMIYQSIVSFPKIVNILMNTAPDGLNIADIKSALSQVDGVRDVHHIHVWHIDENEVALDCHIVAYSGDIILPVKHILQDRFNINHCTIQIDSKPCADDCCHL